MRFRSICFALIVHLLHSTLAIGAPFEINRTNPEDTKQCAAYSYRYNSSCICNPGYIQSTDGSCQYVRKLKSEEARYQSSSFTDIAFDQCSKEETQILTNSIGYAKEVVKKLIAYATYYAETDQQSENVATTGHLNESIDTLRCIDERLSTMNHACHVNGLSCGDRVIAYVNWRFGNTVNWCDFGTDRFSLQGGESLAGTVANLIHEVSHKCGTFDSHRVVAKSVRDEDSIPWSLIAASYESWALYGFCYPNEKSPAFCNARDTYPKWMSGNGADLKIPMIITESSAAKANMRQTRYKKLVDSGHFSEEYYQFLMRD